MALSNMPVSSTTLLGDTKRYQFHRTPKICTYLLAFSIGSFDVLSGFTKRGIPVDVYATSGKSDHLQFALDECIKFIDWYEDFIGVPYPLPRMQLLAVPEFNAGAMENYGLIIFREECLLANPASSSSGTLMNISMIIAHELAHQWSGDSVSPKFWDSLWLNEGFATIFPYIAFDDVHPEWHFWSKFVVLEFSSALLSDASAHTHPVNVEVNSEEEIESIFDEICYSKAACVIRMLLTKLGKESFCKVLRSYFSEFNNGNADTSDLCNTFSKVLGCDMTHFFDAWTNRCNFPLVIVEEDMTIRQAKFTSDGIIEGESWPLPLSISACKGGVVSDLFIELGDSPIHLDTSYDWIKVNSESKSFCRVWHKGEVLTSLLNAVREKKLSEIDRWSVLSDQRALAKLGASSYADVLRLLQCYSGEDSAFVCREVAGTFSSLMNIFKVHKDKLKSLGMRTFSSMLQKFGLEPREGEDVDVQLVRPTLLNIAAFECGDRSCIEFGVQLFDKLRSGNEGKIHPSLLGFAMKCGTMYVEKGFEFVSEIALKSENPQEQAMAAFALCWVPKERIGDAIGMIEKVKLKDTATVFQGIASNPNVENELWVFLTKNYGKFFELFKKTSFNLDGIIRAATSGFETEEGAEEVERFFEENPTPIAAMEIKKCIEDIRIIAGVVKRDADKVGAVLQNM